MYQSFAMPSIVKILRAVAEPNRLRLLLLLRGEELSVAEMQEILAMGQSTISTHLSQLKQAGLVEDRRAGKSSLYRLTTSGGGGVLDQILAEAKGEIPEAAGDQAAIRSVVRKRQDKMRSFFDSVAGRLGKDYVPGQSWKGVAEALLRLMPPMVVADLGAGEGAFALLLAQSAKKVIAVDTSAKMIEVGREQALRHGVKNVEYRLGDMEEVPIDDAEADLVFFSQSLHHALHPERAIQEAWRILRHGGRIAILDLVKHRFEEARELYADEWLGFSGPELEAMLENASADFDRSQRD
jgi:ArsR family transcriptional regulator